MIKVFIVDDSKLVRERLAELVSEISCVEVVDQTGDPRQVIPIIHEKHPDVVILDIRMPGKSGIDLIPDIKKAQSAPTVIILTNYPYPQYRKKCLDAGADYFLNKAGDFDKVGILLRDFEIPTEESGSEM
jgi:DNA-binding NarL/FixJ family response regulator